MAANGQSKLNGNAALLVNEIKSGTAVDSTFALKSQKAATQAEFFVLASDVESASALICEAGGSIIDIIDNIIIADIPVMAVEEIAADSSVSFVELSPMLRTDMNYARPAGNVDEAQTGFEFEGINHSFSGKGVVTGLMDTGLDPNHINFRDASGDSRVKVVYHYSGNNSNPIAYTTPSMISSFTTDSRDDTHGTHVAGIMAGSYNGNGTYAHVASATGSRVTRINGPIPYYGVATDADLAICCGVLSSGNVTSALKNIFDYAKSAGKPAVANLSLGNNGGPHDGSELYSQTLASLAKRGIICISAGNEGDVPLYVNYKFSSSDNEMKTFITSNKASGTVEVWGKDNTPFKVTWALYAKSGGNITDIISVDAAGQTATTNNNNNFKTYYSGAISSAASVNNLNNRYNVVSSISATPLRSGMDLALIVEGSDGQEIYIYGNNPESTPPSFTSNRLSGWTDGSCDGSINAMACAKGLISIGSFNSRTTWGTLGSTSSFYYPNQQSGVGEISDFSSWGETFQGQWLPYVCAPGSSIVSSLSRYYVQSHNSQSSAAAEVTSDNITYWWGAMQGTSMSCPYAAGVVALWLEADPTLTYEEVIDIIKATSVSQSGGLGGLPGLGGGSDDDSSKRWGAGKIDAVAGLKEVLKRSDAVENIFADDDMRLIVEAVDGGYKVFVAGESSVKADIVDMQGRVVASASAEGCEVAVGTAGIAPGVYVLDIRGASSRFARKIRL